MSYDDIDPICCWQNEIISKNGTNYLQEINARFDSLKQYLKPNIKQMATLTPRKNKMEK